MANIKLLQKLYDDMIRFNLKQKGGGKSEKKKA